MDQVESVAAAAAAAAASVVASEAELAAGTAAVARLGFVEPVEAYPFAAFPDSSPAVEFPAATGVCLVGAVATALQACFATAAVAAAVAEDSFVVEG